VIRLLAFVFFGFFVYGLIVGPIGLGLIALVMGVFTLYAEKQFHKRDIEYYASPRSAKCAETPTINSLQDHDCECS
jgi:hypothetical protein